MSAAKLSLAYDDFLDFVIHNASPKEILAYEPSEVAKERAEELLEKNSAGTLTRDEQAELDQMLQVDRLVSVLKARALETLSQA